MFRPTFETLEERVVFSAAPLHLPADSPSLSPNYTPIETQYGFDARPGVVGTDHAWGRALSFSWGVSATGMSVVGDFNGDGRDDLAEFASQGMFARIVPSMEQDNAVELENDLVSHLTGQLRGEAIDIIPLVQPPVESDRDATAHDAAFSPQGPGSEGYEAWDDPRRQQIIAVLIGLLADRSAGTVAGELSSSRMADFTDGTSNTLLFSQRAALGEHLGKIVY